MVIMILSGQYCFRHKQLMLAGTRNIRYGVFAKSTIYEKYKYRFPNANLIKYGGGRWANIDKESCYFCAECRLEYNNHKQIIESEISLQENNRKQEQELKLKHWNGFMN